MIQTSYLLSFLTGSLCCFLALFHAYKVGYITLLDWALLGIGSIYGFGWIFVLYTTLNGDNKYWQDKIISHTEYYIFHSVCTLLLVISIFLGWYLVSRVCKIRRVNYEINNTNINFWVRSFFVLFFLSVLCQGLYTLSYGGYFGIIEYSSLIRSGLFEEIPGNKFSFLKPFAGMSMIASYGFFGLIISNFTRRIILIGFFAAFIFSLYLLYTWLGRMGFLLYLFTFIFGYVLSKTTSPLKLMTMGALCFVLCLFSAYAVSNILSLKSSSSIVSFIAREISFPFASFISQIENSNHLDRYLIDFIFTPLYLLPSSWWSSWFTQVGEINTEVIMGAAKGVDGVTGAIPVDILTLGLMQGHFPGIMITGVIFGILLRYLQFKTFDLNIMGLRYMLEAYLILKISLFSLFYAQPNMVIIGNFPLIASALFCISFLFVKERVKNL